MKSENRKICLVTGNHLCHNPRVLKSAEALTNHGFSVEVLGAWIDPDLKARDEALLVSVPFRFTPVLDLTVNRFSRLRRRTRSRAAHLAQQIMHLENRWQLGYFYPELRRAAMNWNVDLFITHSEQAMAVGVDLLCVGRRVGVDMEDRFSEDLLPEARKYRPIVLLNKIERLLLQRCWYTTCPSRAMSDALAREYKAPPPAVIYNAFRWSEREFIDGLLMDRKN